VPYDGLDAGVFRTYSDNKITYNPGGPNSNSFSYSLLYYSGFSPPTLDAIKFNALRMGIPLVGWGTLIDCWLP